MEKNFTLRTIVLIKAVSISIGIGIGILLCRPEPSRLQIVTTSDTITKYQMRIDTLTIERTKLKTIYEKDIDRKIALNYINKLAYLTKETEMCNERIATIDLQSICTYGD